MSDENATGSNAEVSPGISEVLRKCARRIPASNTFPMYIRSIAIAGHIIGILFKTLHWPGANIILLASSLLLIGTLSILLIRKPGPWSVQMRLPGMLVGSLITVLTGGMFKMMHWP